MCYLSSPPALGGDEAIVDPPDWGIIIIIVWSTALFSFFFFCDYYGLSHHVHILNIQVLTRGAKVLYESCVDTVQYEEFFKGK